jgi:tetratricopeptide (TPR) repeat protein
MDWTRSAPNRKSWAKKCERCSPARASNPLSGIYLDNGKYDEAFELIQKSIDIKESTNDVRGLAYALYGRGKVYIKKLKFQEAITDLQKAIRIHNEMGDRMGEAMTLIKLGLAYKEIKQYDEAEKKYNNAISLAQEFINGIWADLFKDIDDA